MIISFNVNVLTRLPLAAVKWFQTRFQISVRHILISRAFVRVIMSSGATSSTGTTARREVQEARRVVQEARREVQETRREVQEVQEARREVQDARREVQEARREHQEARRELVQHYQQLVRAMPSFVPAPSVQPVQPGPDHDPGHVIVIGDTDTEEDEDPSESSR